MSRSPEARSNKALIHTPRPFSPVLRNLTQRRPQRKQVVAMNNVREALHYWYPWAEGLVGENEKTITRERPQQPPKLDGKYNELIDVATPLAHFARQKTEHNRRWP
jgi:hypothetical protein